MRMGGLSYNSSTENRYRYNGKEYHQELGLGLYDYGFRWYNPAIARFVSVDPLAEKFHELTTYQYASNTPIQAIDLDGLEAWEVKFDRRRLKQKPPERSAEDKLGPIIGYSLSALAAVAGGGAIVKAVGWRAIGTFVANEVKDEDLSRATGGLSDVADISKQAKNLGKEVLSKGERLKIFIKNLTEADSPSNPDEALDLINKTMDEVEDTYSGVKKNPNAASMPNRDDGRMYGILDDTFVKRHEDSSLTARTKGNKIEIGSDGSIKILSKDGEKTFLDKPGKQE